MNIVAVDCGRKLTKITTKGRTKTIPSVVGGWVERELGKYGDYEVHLEGLKHFVGDLAFIESHTCRENAESTKLTDEFKILTLTAIAAMNVANDITLITAVPVSQHNQETKDAIVAMFIGDHFITINGATKFITIKEVLVTVEGAGIYYNNPAVEGYCQVLDIGSRTINMLTMYNNRFVSARSYTLDYGCFMYEENLMTKEDFASKIAGDVKKKWLDYDKNKMYIGGGGVLLAGEQIHKHFPRATLVENPVEANSLGFDAMAVAKCQKS